ncbi:hypothetical protein SODALDRAFT_359840 [Sodiomyces alkalinus F11]|uniref:Uncharacterized protein n=1 Tax=Sodiomyces alkalinus (strain CBS 110278 / VKM F-3762 / F11) TaxID=1314773 RepID=A0A3N2PWH3_SODAK|nr:hypothetical protein SODALDRAFT_359840 [Sodiomyces alkalinus F11]ROT38736.1 hypothetical protein SODALDRAFT_359840 [Sodiomyces alkalinus F11]
MVMTGAAPTGVNKFKMSARRIVFRLQGDMVNAVMDPWFSGGGWRFRMKLQTKYGRTSGYAICFAEFTPPSALCTYIHSRLFFTQHFNTSTLHHFITSSPSQLGYLAQGIAMDRRNVSKRKRSSTSTSTSILSSSQPHNHPSDTINPLSHTPSTLHQLHTAGLSEVDNLPSTSQPGFPHQPWRDPTLTTKPKRRRRTRKSRHSSRTGTDTESGTDAGTDVEPETESDSGTSRPISPSSSASELPDDKSYAAERAALRPLARSIRTFLSRGDIPAAKRAFGLLMRSRISGKPVDIRRNHYWELGAEILMRERPLEEEEEDEEEQRDGEVDAEQDASQERRRRQQHLYPLQNVPRVREYFETLIRRYPHHLGARRAASALQFYPALISYEVIQCHARLTIALADLDTEAEGWDVSQREEGPERSPGYSPGAYTDDDEDEDAEVDPYADPFDPERVALRLRRRHDPEDRIRRARDEIYGDAIDAMRSLAARMDRKLEETTFTRSPELLRLRGTVSLYIADLFALRHASASSSADQLDREAEQRAAEMEAARTFFRKMVDCGGRLDAALRTAVGMDEEDSEEEEVVALPAFSSLPIRDGRPGG